MNFEGKVVLITGASRGIGRATAIEFAKKGANVVVNYLKEKEKAEEVVNEIRKIGRSAIAIRADVSKKEECIRLVRESVDKMGRLDVLVNNAGIFIFTPLDKCTEEDFDRVTNTNLKSQLFLIQAAASELKKNKGSIINISSIFGPVEAVEGCVAYATSKVGVVALTKIAALELAPEVRVNAVLPGVIKTDMTAGDTPEHIAYYIKRTPMKRLGEPEEVAKMICFLASDDASYITGHEFIVDGGMTTRTFLMD